MNNLNYSHLDSTIDFKFKNAVKNYQKGNFLSTQEDCHYILENSPNNFKAINLLGLTYLQQKKYNESKNKFEKCLSINPDYFEARYNLATCLMKQNDLDNALYQLYTYS